MKSNIKELTQAQKKFIKKCSEPNLFYTFGIALFCFSGCFLLAFIGFNTFLENPVSHVLTKSLLIFFIAVLMRGLEGMMHEASHCLWCRNKKLNDLLATLLIVFPLGKSLLIFFRKGHNLHHGRLNSLDDPDRINYEFMRYDNMDRSSGLKLLSSIIVRYPKMYYNWFIGVKSTATSLFGFIWFNVFLIYLIAIFNNLDIALSLWLTYYLIPLFCILPALRILGESEEHIIVNDQGQRYKELMLDCSFNNASFFQRWCVHPFNDWSHVVHHLKPNVLQWYQPAVAKIIFETDPLYRQKVLARHSLLDTPKNELIQNKYTSIAIKKAWHLSFFKKRYAFRLIVLEASNI